VFPCGVMWCRFGRLDAGEELHMHLPNVTKLNCKLPGAFPVPNYGERVRCLMEVRNAIPLKCNRVANCGIKSAYGMC
jgi:hypothetical protein